jgi:DsbC/DsbD-like thiol-disulfide interchange protein
MKHRLMHICRLACAGLALSAGGLVAKAEDASVWQTDLHSELRLIAGSNTSPQSPLRAGIDIRLAPGWKTYWRYPGDSGVPPQFDFTGSSNVKSVDVLWPAPSRFSDGGGFSIGYHDHLVLPLRVVAKDATQPVALRLKISYAICEKLCVPAQGTAELTLARVASALDPELTEAEARVPQPTKIGADGPLAIRALRRDDKPGHPQVVVDVMAPKDVPVDLFVEGPTPEWALPLPEPRPGTGPRSFVFELDGLPADTKPDGAMLTFTLTAGGKAIETKARLD